MSWVKMSLETIWLVSFIMHGENRRGAAESLNRHYAYGAGKRKFSHVGARPIKIHSAFVEERFTALMAGAEPASYAEGNFLFLCATPGQRVEFIASLSLLRVFSALFLQPPWRDTGHPVHTVLPDTFSSITVMQSLKVKHGAIIRCDILRSSLASFLRAARKTSTETTKNEGTVLRFVSIRKLRCRDIRFTRRVLSAFIATASPSLSATLINRDETEQDGLTDRSVDTFVLNSVYTKLKRRERKKHCLELYRNGRCVNHSCLSMVLFNFFFPFYASLKFYRRYFVVSVFYGDATQMKSCIAAHVPQMHLTNNAGCSNNNGEGSKIKPAKIKDSISSSTILKSIKTYRLNKHDGIH